MDAWGILIFGGGLLLYFLAGRKPAFLFVSGAGLGIIIGAIWASQALR